MQFIELSKLHAGALYLKLMLLTEPLLAVGVVVSSYLWFRPMVASAAPTGLLVAAIDGEHGPGMHAVESLDSVPPQELRRLDVCRDHAFLDQHMRIITVYRYDLFDLACRVEDDTGLGRIEIDRTTLPA